MGALEPLTSAGQAVLTGLALAWVATVPIPRRMRRERLEFSWWIAQGPRKPEEPVIVRIALRNPTNSLIVLATPRLSLSPGLRQARWKGARIELPAMSVSTFDLELTPGHAGRHVLHGAWMTVSGPLGLAWAPLYFPNPLVLEIAPRSQSARARRTVHKPEREARSGRSSPRMGEGAEIRELREHRPGDPYHRIAWKASARKGKLLVRETEDDAQTTRVLVMDVGPSMRGDLKGGSKLDYAIELIAQAARSTQMGGDRLGLVAFDSRITCKLPPGATPAHLHNVVETAIDQRCIFDEDLTDLDDEQLEQTVARYFREQEGVEIAPGPKLRAQLVHMAQDALKHDPLLHARIEASDEKTRILRAFCKARGILLPLRHDGSGVARRAGLGAALLAAIEGAREPRTIMVLSDLDPFDDALKLKPLFAQAHAGRHRLSVIAPMGADFATAQDTPIASAVKDALVEDDQLRIALLRDGLGAMGVPVFSAKKSDTFVHWLARASSGHYHKRPR
jgi:uncharacterized protein (DUF58 family)